ncbi:MAG: T9SS type A sorting domain-containing protein [Ignavibacteriae bacterium]|nr:T9SS type A sorting domain-containing protein [Ignavibacteriota bacterium]
MYKLILISFLFIAGSLKAQNGPSTIFSNTVTASQEQVRLSDIVKSSPVNSSLYSEINTDDFRNKAQKGLDFMMPGSSVSNLRCDRITNWSDNLSIAFADYLKHIRKDDMDQLSPGAIESKVTEFKNKNYVFGIMTWEVRNGLNLKQINSVVIFDRNWNVMFDTELVKYAIGVSEIENQQTEFEADNNSPNSASTITNQRSGSMTFSYVVEGTFDDVTHYNKVSATAIVPPYITAATNDAFFNSNTTQIISERRNVGIFSPSTEPCLYFGTGGSIGNSYSSATPFSSRVYLSNTNDHFNDGTYEVSGSNGHSWSFSFDFSVSAGPVGLGITPQQSSPTFTLSATSFSEVRVKNYVYYYLLGNTYRALFYDGGALRMNNFNILTGDGNGEVGSVTVKLPMQVAYWSLLILYPYSFTGVTLTLSNIEYLRGDHIRQPTYTLTSSDTNIAIGETDTLKAVVRNNSQEVKLSGGNVSIDVSSLGGHLTLLSPATLSLGEINTNSSKTYNFIVRGNSSGIVTPQVNISSAGWTWPVPPDVVINNIFSIDENITVGTVGINQTSSEIPVDYSISQNYPNPFNPVTNIDFSIPKNGFVKITVYDMLGKEIQNLVNENLNAGFYKADFKANNLPSGTYFYRIEAKDFVQIRKMTLLK